MNWNRLAFRFNEPLRINNGNAKVKKKEEETEMRGKRERRNGNEFDDVSLKMIA